MAKSKQGYLVVAMIKGAAACSGSSSSSSRISIMRQMKILSSVVMKQCKSLKQVHQLHAHSVVAGLFSSPPNSHHYNININNLLLTTFLFSATASASAQHHDHHGQLLLRYALCVFNLISNPSTFSFNNIIRAHSLLSSPLQALVLFARMRRLSLPPDFHTFPFALNACAHLSPTSLSIAQALHSQALKLGFSAHSFLANTLIHVYSLCCRLSDASRIFHEDPSRRDVVSYNTLIDAFLKAGDVSSARKLFDQMPLRDSVSWGTILAAYAHSNRCDETLRLFYQMLELQVTPDNVALVSALSACAQLGDLERGRTIHNYIRTNGIRLDSFLTTGLVDLYAKCGCIGFAKEIFDASSDKNLCTWNAMLVGFSMHGLGQLSQDYFSRMIKTGVKPDSISFLGVLVGCSHAGLVDEARKLFDDMESVYKVPRELKHYGCMADLLGRAGLIEEAMQMIRKMPMGGDVFVWGGLLAGCRLHGNVEMAKKAAECVVELKPEDAGVYSIMANVYANAEQWDDVVKVRRSMDSKRVKKKHAGCSLIRLDGVTHEFVAGDTLHPQTDEICSILNGLERHQFEAF